MKWMLSQRAPDSAPGTRIPGVCLSQNFVKDKINEKSHDLISWERIGTESNRSTWNSGGLFIHKLRPFCASYPLEYYPSDDSAIGLSVRPTFTDARLERFGLRLRLRLFLCNISSYCRANGRIRTCNQLSTNQTHFHYATLA